MDLIMNQQTYQNFLYYYGQLNNPPILYFKLHFLNFVNSES